MSMNHGSDANEFIYLFVCTLCSKSFFSSSQKPKFGNNISSLIRNMVNLVPRVLSYRDGKERTLGKMYKAGILTQ